MLNAPLTICQGDPFLAETGTCAEACTVQMIKGCRRSLVAIMVGPAIASDMIVQSGQQDVLLST